MLPKEKDARFNFLVGTLNGAVFMFGVAFMDPTTVLPVFIKQFTESDFLVGLGSSLHRAGWHLPQLVIAGFVESRPYRLGLYLRANAVRMALIWSFLPILYFYGLAYPAVVLAVFLLLYGTSHFFGGIAGLPFSDLVGKTIPRSHWGTFYALRFFLGPGLLSIAAGMIIQYVFDDASGYYFPTNYVIIFALAATFMTLGIVCFGLLREPAGKVSEVRRSLGGVMREVPAILRRDDNYRRLFIAQMLTAGSGLALPFYVIVARERFGVDASTIGVFLATQTVGVMLSNAVWGWVSSRRGNRAVVRATAFLQALIPIYALAALPYIDSLASGDARVVISGFVPIFFLVGSTVAGSFVGFKSFLLDVAPEDRRPTYLGITNTMMGFASLFPAVGGVLAAVVGHRGVFAVTAVVLVSAFVMTGRLVQPETD